MQVLDRTSKEYNWQRRENQVVQQNECVLVEVGGIETDGTELAFVTEDVADAHLLNGKDQNMANTQMTFYPLDKHS